MNVIPFPEIKNSESRRASKDVEFASALLLAAFEKEANFREAVADHIIREIFIMCANEIAAVTKDDVGLRAMFTRIRCAIDKAERLAL